MFMHLLLSTPECVSFFQFVTLVVRSETNILGITLLPYKYLNIFLMNNKRIIGYFLLIA
jgi:hypothetical protein